MIVTKALLTQAETVEILSRALGKLTAWPAFLGDIRRTERPGKAPPDLYGHQLHPFAFTEKRIPLYQPASIREFIELVKSETRGIERKGFSKFKFDNTPGVPWKMRKAELAK